MNTILSMLLPALLVSGSCAIAMALSAGAPVRLRLAIAAVGLLSWVVPWPMLNIPFMSFDVAHAVGWRGDAAPDLASASATAVTQGSGGPQGAHLSVSFTWVAAALLLGGLLMFAADVARYRRTLNAWRREAADGEHLRALLPRGVRHLPHAIRVVPRSDIAAATGLLRGTIWIGDRLANHPQLGAALLHECMHVARKDVAAILVVSLIKRLYFWNPVVRYFAHRVGFLIEAACDERCAQWLGRAEYRSGLATLILDLQEVRNLDLVPMVKSMRHDVARVAALAQVPRLDARACIAAALCALGLGAAATLNAQQDRPDPRIGSWVELKTTDNFSGLLRVFKPLDSGMIRLYLNAKVLEKNQIYIDYKCDGGKYRSLNHDGKFTGTMYSCRVTGPRTVESSFTYGPAEPGIQPSLTPEDSTSAVATEAVSEDGKQLATRVVHTLRKGGTREARRDFVRRGG